MEIVKRIVSEMSSISRPQYKFLIVLFSTMMALRGKMNFRNLSRYSDLSEMSYLRNFRKPFDFALFNHLLIWATIPSSHTKVGAIDCSYIAKSGKHTYGVEYFFSSRAGRSKRGLELSVLCIVDIEYNSAYSLVAQQTPGCLEIGQGQENRMDFYLKHLRDNQSYLKEQGISHIVADGLYAKKRFIEGVCSLEFDLISKLRGDANLRYLYKGLQKAGRGAPKRYDGKVLWVWDDLIRWELVEELEKGVFLYTAELNCPQFKRNLRVVCLLDRRRTDKIGYALIFSTDLCLKAKEIYRMYKARFQIEFIFRDAKGFMGLCDCQARNKQALHFHFNASLTALNLVRKQDRQLSDNSDSWVCSIASWKARYFNEHLLDRFISYLDLEPDSIKNHPRYEELRNYGAIAT